MNTLSAELELRRALAEFSYGNLATSLDLLTKYARAHGENAEAEYFRRKILDRLRSAPLQPPFIMWRPGTRGLWEQDWLDSLLPNLPSLEPDAPEVDLADRTVIVIDNRMTELKRSFYRNAYQHGCRIILIHLSDEAFEDDYDTYRWCHRIFRNYHSPIFQEKRHVSCFALGFKSGFGMNEARPSVDARNYVWSFAGDAAKSSRREMLEEMRKVGGGREHLTSGFNSPDALGTGSYSELLRRSVFVPCPMGYVNMDSFRVYEALEAGCIPITERRPGFNYFSELFGAVPFPSVLHWAEAPTLIEHLQRHRLVEELQRECTRWWDRYKASLKSRIMASVDESQSASS